MNSKRYWTTWNMDQHTVAVATDNGYHLVFLTGVGSIGEAVERLGDSGYIVVTEWKRSAMSDVLMVCMVEQDKDEAGGPRCGWLQESGKRVGCILPAGHSGKCDTGRE
ncbi:MAG TPA: hypothetical protein VFI97_03545 [Arthrobacter sp.]|nr:hypothetical protein [Arthrobacter sp.]